jgi:glycosyltransferase involved in cell wall biosynthesis
MKIIFVIYSMRGGGAEKILAVLSNYLIKKNHKITIYTLTGKTVKNIFKLNKKIKLIHLDLAGNSKNFIHAAFLNLKRIFYLRRIITANQPDILLPFMTETALLCISASLFTKIPVIACEMSDPWNAPKGPVWRVLRIILYRKAERVIALSADSSAYFSKYLIKCDIIPPAADIKQTNSGYNAFSKKIITMGRLEKVKGHDVSLTAFSRFLRFFPNWKLIILGIGPMEKELKKFCLDHNISKSVIFKGFIKNPQKILENASVYIQSSRYEGFGMSIIDALSCGLPIL